LIFSFKLIRKRQDEGFQLLGRVRARNGSEILYGFEELWRNFELTLIGRSRAHGDGGAKLEPRTAGAIKVPERCDVRSIRTNASSINRQTQIFGLFDAHARFIEFGQAIAFSGNQPVPAREVHRARRTVCAPALSYDYEKIVPVSSIPHIPPNASGSSVLGHVNWMQAPRFG
jgi:hypothetical protein